MKAKKAGKIILFASFLAVLCAAWLFWAFLARFMDTSNYENRGLHTVPEITSPETYQEFPKRFEWFIEDHAPFRNELITLQSAADYYAFGRGNDRTAVGKDGWLFYADWTDGDPIACYQGTNLLMEVHLRQIAEKLTALRDRLAGQGCEFVILIAPNKERVYFDKMPEKYGLPAEEFRAGQIIRYLREHTDLRIVWPLEELQAARKALPEDLYYKTDTHWNRIGGYVASRALLRELGIDLPDITSEGITVSYAGERTGDLSRHLGMREILKSPEYDVAGYDDHGAQSVEEIEDAYWYRAENADPRKLYMVRDSFFVSMAPFIHTQFNESFSRYFPAFRPEEIEQQQPDIFVFECVERYIDHLTAWE